MNRKHLAILSIFLIAIIVISTLYFKPEVATKKYSVTVGYGDEKATVEIKLGSFALGYSYAEWVNENDQPISQLTISAHVLLSDVNNMKLSLDLISIVKIKIKLQDGTNTIIYTVNITAVNNTYGEGSITKTIDQFVADIGVTFAEGEIKYFDCFLYDAQIYLKGLKSGNNYVADFDEQVTAFTSFAVKKPLTSPIITKITRDTQDGADVTTELLDASASTVVDFSGSTGASLTCYLYFYVEGDWSNIYFKLTMKCFAVDTNTLGKTALPCEFYIDGVKEGASSGSTTITDVTIASGDDWSSYASNGVFELKIVTYTPDSNDKPYVVIYDVYFGEGTASWIIYAGLGSTIVVIALLVLFFKKRRVRHARRH